MLLISLLAMGAATFAMGLNRALLKLRAAGLPVFARGTSCLTTKRVRSERPGAVRRGAGQSGRLGARRRQRGGGPDPEEAAGVLGQALASDAAEPALMPRIADGEPLDTVLAT